MKRKVRFAGVMFIILAFVLSGCGLQGTDQELANFLIQAVGGGSTEEDAADDTGTTEKSTKPSTTVHPTEDKSETATKETTEETTVGTTTVATEAATEAALPAWKEAYIQLVQDRAANVESVSAGVVDIDLDGMPELLIYTPNDSGVYCYGPENDSLLCLPESELDAGRQYYQYGDYLIGVNKNYVGGQTAVLIAQKSNRGTWLHSDFVFGEGNQMEPVVGVLQSAGSYEPSFEEAQAMLAEFGVSITYYYDGANNCLVYEVTVNAQEIPMWNSEGAIVEGIRSY